MRQPVDACKTITHEAHRWNKSLRLRIDHPCHACGAVTRLNRPCRKPDLSPQGTSQQPGVRRLFAAEWPSVAIGRSRPVTCGRLAGAVRLPAALERSEVACTRALAPGKIAIASLPCLRFVGLASGQPVAPARGLCRAPLVRQGSDSGRCLRVRWYAGSRERGAI